MKQLRKAALGFALCFTLASILPSLPSWKQISIIANAEEYVWDEEKVIQYAVYDDHAEVVSCDDDYEGEVEILSQVHGVPVTIIAEDAFEECSLSGLMVPDSVTGIDEWAFSDCDYITHISFGSGVEDAHALPINSWNLESITVSKDNPYYTSDDGVLYDKKKTKIIAYPRMKQGAFSIPKGITEISSGEFESCDELTSISIPDSVTSIGSYAFGLCDKLNKVELPNSVTSIGDFAFRQCDSLESIAIPSKLSKIGDGVFLHCKSLNSVSIPNGIKALGQSMFEGCISLKSIVLPDSLEGIELHAFSGCTALSSINIPSRVKYISWSAFSGCAALTKINIPEGVT